MQADAIRKQLNGGHIVLLGNLAYSAAGEILNCDCYSVATQAAIDLQADKLFCITTPSLQPFDLPQWLPISDAEQLLQNLLETKDADVHAPAHLPGATACHLCPCAEWFLVYECIIGMDRNMLSWVLRVEFASDLRPCR